MLDRRLIVCVFLMLSCWASSAPAEEFESREEYEQALSERVDEWHWALAMSRRLPDDPETLYRQCVAEAALFLFDELSVFCDLHIDKSDTIELLAKAVGLDPDLAARAEGDPRLDILRSRLDYYFSVGYDTTNSQDVRRMLVGLNWHCRIPMNNCYYAIAFQESGSVSYQDWNNDVEYEGTFEVIDGEVLIRFPASPQAEFRGRIVHEGHLPPDLEGELHDESHLQIDGLPVIFVDTMDNWGC